MVLVYVNIKNLDNSKHMSIHTHALLSKGMEIFVFDGSMAK